MVDLNLPKKRVMENRASILKRILAFVLDLIIVYFIVFLPLLAPVVSQFESSIPEDAGFVETLEYSSSPEIQENTPLIIRSFISFALVFLYFVIFEIILNQTPGKMFFKLYVVSREKKLNWKQVLLRNLVFIPLGTITSILWIVEILFLIFTGSRMLDNVAKTDVIEEISI